MESYGRARAWLAILITIFNTLTLGILIFVVSFIPYLGRRIGEWLIWLWAQMALRLTGMRIKVEGRENIRFNHCIYMSNHQSYLDSMILYRELRKIKFIILGKFKKFPFFGWSLWAQGHLFIYPGKGRRALRTLDESIQKLKNGTAILIFPEGARQQNISNFQKGGFRMAQKSGQPIIPVSITGSYDAMPKGKFMLYRKKIRVVFGKMIDTQSFHEKDINQLMSTVKNEIIKNM